MIWDMGYGEKNFYSEEKLDLLWEGGRRGIVLHMLLPKLSLIKPQIHLLSLPFYFPLLLLSLLRVLPTTAHVCQRAKVIRRWLAGCMDGVEKSSAPFRV